MTVPVLLRHTEYTKFYTIAYNVVVANSNVLCIFVKKEQFDIVGIIEVSRINRKHTKLRRTSLFTFF